MRGIEGRLAAIVANGANARQACQSRTTDYRSSPEPPLSDEEAAWADSLLKSTGKR
jgi:hypothetical protein